MAPAAVVEVVVGAFGKRMRTALPRSANAYTPLVRLRVPVPGSRIPATAYRRSRSTTAPPATAPFMGCDHRTVPSLTRTARRVKSVPPTNATPPAIAVAA